MFLYRAPGISIITAVSLMVRHYSVTIKPDESNSLFPGVKRSNHVINIVS